jgi:C4-dicarboxylate transporter, DctQ subunit
MMFDYLESIINNICKYLAIIAGLSTFFMMMVASADVIMVAFRVGSLSIAVGLVEMLMIVTVFGAIAYADVLDRHVTATMVISRFGIKWQSLINIFNNFVSLVICIIFAWQILIYALDMTYMKKTCLSSSLLYYPFTWFAVIGFFLLTLRYIIRIVQNIKNSLKGEFDAGA